MSAAKPDREDGTQYVAVKCDCNTRGGAYLKHYEIVRCPRCGNTFWALQPTRGSRLVAKLHPGPNLTRREYAEKYPDDKEES